VTVGTARLDFEHFDEVCKIAGRQQALSKKMHVIRHDAVGMDCKAASSGFRTEYFEKSTTD
jgi:hypothetical protein